MLCVVALIIFSVMGIFSASHRELAKEAAKCVFRRVTFRACNTTFQDKAKGKILNWFLRESPFTAKLFNKYSEVLSWIFIILMIGSTVWAARGIYNYYAYGSCNGLNASGFCVFDPTGENNQISDIGTECRVNAPKEADLKLEPLIVSEYPNKAYNSSSSGKTNQLVFIGCYACEYTRRAYPIIQKLLQKNKVDYIFVHFPVKQETEYITAYAYAAYKQNPEKFWQLNELFFASLKSELENKDYVFGLIRNLGFDLEKIKSSAESKEMQDKIFDMYEETKQTGIYGTPTIFINGKAFVGPKPERVYRRVLR